MSDEQNGAAEGSESVVERVVMRNYHLLWMLMSFDVYRYLMSNTEGRLDGVEKYDRHKRLCDTYAMSVLMCDEESLVDHIEYWEALHEKTQELTGYMDEVIGFPIYGEPDYDDLAPKFFAEFIKLADSVLSA